MESVKVFGEQLLVTIWVEGGLRPQMGGRDTSGCSRCVRVLYLDKEKLGFEGKDGTTHVLTHRYLQGKVHGKETE